ncbi:MAG: hypothetical protein KIT48_15920 [Pseudolabrys sp.]|nr:hypothetical protein [Pseudolabrys sp.]
MKTIVVALALAVFAGLLVSPVWAVGYDLKSGKPLPKTKAACEKAGLKWNESTKKCSK